MSILSSRSRSFLPFRRSFADGLFLALLLVPTVHSTSTAHPRAAGTAGGSERSLIDFRQVDAGSHHTCGVSPEGTAYCWGENDEGQLGVGTSMDHPTPVRVSTDHDFVQISAGGQHTCGVTEDGAAYCWGANGFGQLGDGSADDRPEPVSVAGDLRFERVSAGESYTCGVTEDGVAYCWGDNDFGQLGDGSTSDRSKPVRVTEGLTFRRVEVGTSPPGDSRGRTHTCGITPDGEPYCWGYNGGGQLGIDTTEGPRTCGRRRGVACSPAPVPVAGERRFVDVSVGGEHTCGVTEDGTAYCWGGNDFGQLGARAREVPIRSSAKPIRVASSKNLEAMSAGGYHTCAVGRGGEVYCWGWGSVGQIGDGTEGKSRNRPVAVVGEGRRLEQVSAGDDHTCGVTEEGTAYCWGGGGSGELGNGSWTWSPTPAAVVGDGKLSATPRPSVTADPDTLNWMQVATGHGHSCGLTEDGVAYCWGTGSGGELGRRAGPPITGLPVRVADNHTFTQISAGWSHTCGVTGGGNVYCWGDNRAGQLGNGEGGERGALSVEPTRVASEAHFAQVSAGYVHTCGVTEGGSAYCWGRNRGRLGDGTTAEHLKPVPVAGRVSFERVRSGWVHTCGLATDGTVYCWGYNTHGALGDGTTTHRREPVPVAGEHSFVQLSVAASSGPGTVHSSHSCGVTKAGKTYCWGYNSHGQLGDGSTTHRREPVAVTTERKFERVATGAAYTCGVTEEGEAYCWGRNEQGQLGNGDTADQREPVPVATKQAFVEITAARHTCGLTIDSAIYCWGDNRDGQLGDRTKTARSEPVPLGGADLTFGRVSAGDQHACELTEGGGLYCWGGSHVGEAYGEVTGMGGHAPDAALRPNATGLGLAFSEVDAAANHACGLTEDGDAYCWGNNAAGKLGNGTTRNSDKPVRVTGDLAFAQLSAAGLHTCGVTEQGVAYCWGSGRYGRLGVGRDAGLATCHRLSPPACTRAPMMVAGGHRFVQVSTGRFHTCGVTREGEVYCWGSNEYGQLGDGTKGSRPTPGAVLGEVTFERITAGVHHTCGVAEGGEAYCWGRNDEGRVGDGTTTDRREPVAVAGGQTFVDLSAGFNHTCGVTRDGDAYCWGNNGPGSLGNGEGGEIGDSSLEPVPVEGDLTFDRVDAGRFLTCGVTRQGRTYCWGWNGVGQLGIGINTGPELCGGKHTACSREPVEVAAPPWLHTK